MFGFGSDDKTPKGDVFDIEEIRQLVLDFPPPSGTSTENNALIPLLSGHGFTTRDALSKRFAALLKDRYGKIPIDALENQLDVERTTLCNVLRSREDFMLSKSKDHVFTTCDQERILQEVFAKTRSRFVRANAIAEEHDIDLRSLEKLIALSDKSTQESPLQFLDSPDQSRTKSLELGNSYVHTLAKLLALQSNVMDMCRNAHTAARVAEWNGNDLCGLDPSTFAKLAHKLAQECQGKDPLYGFFESGQDEVRYVTKSYLLRKAKRTLKQVAMGEEAYCDLEQLVKKYPTLLPDVESAKQVAAAECLHKDGSKYKWHFISHYAIGDVGLNNTAKQCMETLGRQRYLNTKPCVQAFPSTIRRELQILLQDRTIEFWRYCGGEVHSVIGLQEWLVLKTMISDIELASKRIGRTCAESVYKRQIDASLADVVERDIFLQELHGESDMPVELLERLWDDERVKIRAVGTASFEERLAELQAEGKNQIEAIWKSRVYVPAQMYNSAWENLESGPLKDQLEELLRIHLSQDLIPSTLKRIRAKVRLHNASSKKQIEKLEAVIASANKDVPIMKSLDKFHVKMGFSILLSEEVGKAEIEQLENMITSMEKDTDAPRLFLTTLIVLLAVKKEVGILYATGKFAPRLLKLLKTCVEEQLYQELERLKDKVKTGEVADEDRLELRKIAADGFERAKAVAMEGQDTAT